jgi:peroxiredoxin
VEVLKMIRILRLLALLVYSAILMVIFCATAITEEEEDELKVGMKAPDFALQDAEDKNYKLKEMKGNVVVLIMGTRKTRKETDKWAMAIKKDYPKREDLKIFMIADMRSVPWFIPKSFIKGFLKKDKPPATLLLDWDGKTHIGYKTKEKNPDIFIINKVGKIAYRINANYNDEKYQKVESEIEKTFDENRALDERNSEF